MTKGIYLAASEDLWASDTAMPVTSFCDCDCDCKDCLGCLQTVPWLITLDLYAAMSLLRVKIDCSLN